jgi:hypothetical protein
MCRVETVGLKRLSPVERVETERAVRVEKVEPSLEGNLSTLPQPQPSNPQLRKRGRERARQETRTRSGRYEIWTDAAMNFGDRKSTTADP